MPDRSADTPHFTDESVLRAIASLRKGDGEAFSVLAEAYRPMILRSAAAYDVSRTEREDLVQEGYIALYRAALRFDSTRAGFSTFASLCVKRRMINWYEKSLVGGAVSFSELDDTVSDIVDVSQDPEKDVMLSSELDSIFAFAAENFSPFERKVFDLYIKGHSVPEIMDALSVSRKSCENAVARIRRKLRDRR